MHKGLYWSQLVAGIGIGLILVALIWIFANHFAEEKRVQDMQIKREIVCYNISNLSLDAAELTLAKIAEDQLIEFIINPGDTAEIIAANLEDQEIIKNKNVFLKIVAELGLTRKLRSGKFFLKTNSNIDEIVAKLQTEKEVD